MRIVWKLFLITLLLIPHLYAADEDTSDYFIFSEKLGYLWFDKEYSLKSWNESDKAMVIKYSIRAKELAPGLIERVSTFRPVIFYRSSFSSKHPAAHGEAIGSQNGVIFYDSCFESPVLMFITILHEMAHLVDSSRRIENSQFSIEILQPMIDKCRQALKNKGSEYKREELDSLQKKFPNLRSELGLPSLYACDGLKEMLAEFAAYIGGYIVTGYQAQDEVKEFIEKNYLSYPYRGSQTEELFNKATQFYNQGMFPQAIQTYDQILKIEPDFKEVNFFKGYTYEILKYYDAAVFHYLQAYEIFRTPEYFKPSENRIINLKSYCLSNRIRPLIAKMRNPGIAIQGLIYLSKKYPSDLDCFSALEKLFKERKEYEWGKRVYGQMIEENPKNIKALRARADIHKIQSNWKEALTDYNSVIENGGDAYFARAECKDALKDFSGAIADCTKAIELMPVEAPWALYLRGIVYVQVGEFKKGLIDLKKAERYPSFKSKAEVLIKKAEKELAKKKK